MNELADFTVGDRQVRPALGQIVNGLEAVHVEPRSMEVLVALSRRAPELYPKKELIESVWVDAFVSDEVLTHAIWDLRRAFGDNASSPEFIQTIPKRGYRLIAPVELQDDKPTEETAKTGGRKVWPFALGLVLAGLVLAGLVLAAVFLRPSTPPAVSETTRLFLVSKESPSSGFSTFEHELRERLAGTPNLAVEPAEQCPQSTEPVDAFCLEVELDARQDREIVRSQIRQVGQTELLWAPPSQRLEDLDSPRRAANELNELVAAFFEVSAMAYYDDDDIKPWFNITRYDMRAIRDFLVGIEYTFTNQRGGGKAIDEAAERDPGFPAALIWRIPTLVTTEQTLKVERYLELLEGLYSDASRFEKPMIDWANAYVNGGADEQITHLRIALKQEPSRPVSFLLAVTLQRREDLQGAWREYEALIDSGWEFPGLWTAAATCALQDGRMKEARAALAKGRSLDIPDAETLELSILLAVYDQDEPAELRYKERLRVLQLQLEPYEFPLAPFAEILAARADADGRPEAATRLREFTD